MSRHCHFYGRGGVFGSRNCLATYALAGGQVHVAQELWCIPCCKESLQSSSGKRQTKSSFFLRGSLQPKASPYTSEVVMFTSPPHPSGSRRTVEQTWGIGCVTERTGGVTEHLHSLGELKLREADGVLDVDSEVLCAGEQWCPGREGLVSCTALYPVHLPTPESLL